jgi:four helix bundle protein
MVMTEKGKLIVEYGGYHKIRSFEIAQLVYDLTVKFCDKYISIKSRTHDPMVQAARSGVQNIAEGSQTSGTSKKSEIRLTDVARASLEELKLDYEDFLRQRNLNEWERNNSLRQELVDKKYSKAEEVILWVREIHSTGILLGRF